MAVEKGENKELSEEVWEAKGGLFWSHCDLLAKINAFNIDQH